LCLLFPRSGVVGALLLTTVMVGTMGASLGTAIGNRGDTTQLVSQTTFRTTIQNDASVLPAVVVKKSQGWDI
ncbi:MAG: hypothetical protein QOG38_3030, partial [Hyphomicrobiales bacterium]|nr:hypothetical protein [Hyphomicrobiales bacterium]